MAWSSQQETALRDVAAWLKDPAGKQVFRLFGFAGTGKTTLAIEMASMANGSVNYGAFTGKAATVMRSKGCQGADTIHSLIYRPVEDEFGAVMFRLNMESPVRESALTIIDEVSMVGPDIGRDLLSFGTKVLVLGDPAQLPPVDGAGFFTHAEGCEPDVMLTEIHRQAADNPIIAMATRVRLGETLDVGTYGDSRVIMRPDLNAEAILAADQCLVGKNVTRHLWNRRIRELKKLKADTPVKGDKLVCLKNFKMKGFFNGSLWRAEKVHNRADAVHVWVSPFEEESKRKAVSARVLRPFFSGNEGNLSRDERRNFDEFTYGYALTCHKAQGSQWGDVVITDESSVFREDAKRWLYTAITRAAKKVTVAAAA